MVCFTPTQGNCPSSLYLGALFNGRDARRAFIPVVRTDPSEFTLLHSYSALQTAHSSRASSAATSLQPGNTHTRARAHTDDPDGPCWCVFVIIISRLSIKCRSSHSTLLLGNFETWSTCIFHNRLHTHHTASLLASKCKVTGVSNRNALC